MNNCERNACAEQVAELPAAKGTLDSWGIIHVDMTWIQNELPKSATLMLRTTRVDVGRCSLLLLVRHFLKMFRMMNDELIMESNPDILTAMTCATVTVSVTGGWHGGGGM